MNEETFKVGFALVEKAWQRNNSLNSVYEGQQISSNNGDLTLFVLAVGLRTREEADSVIAFVRQIQEENGLSKGLTRSSD
jgi:hypothetical protein